VDVHEQRCGEWCVHMLDERRAVSAYEARESSDLQDRAALWYEDAFISVACKRAGLCWVDDEECVVDCYTEECEFDMLVLANCESSSVRTFGADESTRRPRVRTGKEVSGATQGLAETDRPVLARVPGCPRQERLHARITRLNERLRTSAGNWNGVDVSDKIADLYTNSRAENRRSRENCSEERFRKVPHSLSPVLHHRGDYDWERAVPLTVGTLAIGAALLRESSSDFPYR
jgi:hypothetical protein